MGDGSETAEGAQASDRPWWRRRGYQVGAVMVAVAVLAGSLTAWAGQRASGLPVTGELAGEVAWRAGWRLDESHARTLDFWLDSDVLVWGMREKLVGVDVRDGEVLWELEPPLGEEFCRMSSTVEDGVGVVMTTGARGDRDVSMPPLDGRFEDYEDHYASGETDCVQVSTVDVASGTELWHAAVTYISEVRSGPPQIVAGTVLVPDGAWLYGLDAEDGSELWLIGEELADWHPERCILDMHLSGAEALIHGSCSDHYRDYFLGAVRPTDGHVEWVRTEEYDVPLHPLAYWTMAATDPIVLVQPSRDLIAGSPGLVLDATGTPQTELPLQGGHGFYAMYPTFGDFWRPSAGDFVVDDGILYIRTQRHLPAVGDAERREQYAVAAVDLTTGQERWAWPTPEYQVMPVAVEDNERLIGFGRTHLLDSEDAFAVLAFDLADGLASLLGPGVPLEVLWREETRLGDPIPVAWHDGRLLVYQESWETGGISPIGTITALG